MSFFNYKIGHKKGYMERGGFFYYEIHMKCVGSLHYTLLILSNEQLESMHKKINPSLLIFTLLLPYNAKFV